jgi:hypothetical protein
MKSAYHKLLRKLPSGNKSAAAASYDTAQPAEIMTLSLM